MGEVAYTVRSGFEGFEGGGLAVNDGETFHLGEALRDGKGYVVVDDSDSSLAQRLDEQPALERCDVAAARKAQAPKATKAAAKSEDA
jgi:hypothetical protein